MIITRSLKSARIKVGSRVIVSGTPSRGVVSEIINHVCLVIFDDGSQPHMYRRRDLFGFSMGGLRVKRIKRKGPVGDGVALRSMAHP